MLICNSCGAEIKDGASFCTKCGAALAFTDPNTAETVLVNGENKPLTDSREDCDCSVEGATLAECSDNGASATETTPLAECERAVKEKTEGSSGKAPAVLPAPISSESKSKKEEKPKKNTAYAGYTVLGFFVPLAGLILWLVWQGKKETEEKATAAIKGVIAYYAYTNPIIGLVLYFVLKVDYPDICRGILIATIIGIVVNVLAVIAVILFYVLYFVLMFGLMFSVPVTPYVMPYNYMALPMLLL